MAGREGRCVKRRKKVEMGLSKGLTGKVESVGWAVQISLDSIVGVILRRLMIDM